MRDLSLPGCTHISFFSFFRRCFFFGGRDNAFFLFWKYARQNPRLFFQNKLFSNWETGWNKAILTKCEQQIVQVFMKASFQPVPQFWKSVFWNKKFILSRAHPIFFFLKPFEIPLFRIHDEGKKNEPYFTKIMTHTNMRVYLFSLSIHSLFNPIFP